MKEILNGLNKAFDNKSRLGIMSALMVHEELDFKALKELIGLTDGNLASHLKALEKQTYLQVNKSFIGRKPNTKYKATPLGRLAFEKHLKYLEKIIAQLGK